MTEHRILCKKINITIIMKISTLFNIEHKVAYEQSGEIYRPDILAKHLNTIHLTKNHIKNWMKNLILHFKYATFRNLDPFENKIKR
jgi:hypothetical protein